MKNTVEQEKFFKKQFTFPFFYDIMYLVNFGFEKSKAVLQCNVGAFLPLPYRLTLGEFTSINKKKILSF